MGYIYALLASLLFGANGSVNKVVLGAGVTPSQLTLVRSMSGAVLCGAVLLATNRRAFRVSPRELLALAALGVIGVAMVQWFYALAISRLPVGIALLIEYTAVLIVAVVAKVFFAETVKPRLWLAIGCVLAGLAVVAKIWSSDLALVGIIFAGLAAVTFAAYLLLGERLVTRTSPLATGFWSMLFAGLFWGVFSSWWNVDPGLLASRVSLGGHLGGTVLPVWALLCYIAALGSFLPFLLSFAALGRLKATPVGIVSTTEIVFAFSVAWAWLGEALDTAQLIGASIVIVGVGVAQTARSAGTDRQPVVAASPAFATE